MDFCHRKTKGKLNKQIENGIHAVSRSFEMRSSKLSMSAAGVWLEKYVWMSAVECNRTKKEEKVETKYIQNDLFIIFQQNCHSDD